MCTCVCVCVCMCVRVCVCMCVCVCVCTCVCMCVCLCTHKHRLSGPPVLAFNFSYFIIYAALNTSITLPCPVSGIPVPVITWYKVRI